MRPFTWLRRKIARAIINFLAGPSSVVNPRPTHSYRKLLQAICPGDVLLVEGKLRYSTAVKYFTQSIWSHSAIYIGDEKIIEADLKRGVVVVPLSTYIDHHTRICRPIGLGPEGIEEVLQLARSQIGHTYDLKNVFDLARYLFPVIPIPNKWKRSVFELGSSDPTKVICSSMIASCFQQVHYPVLPTTIQSGRRRFLKKRRSSNYTPADFDRSPYFQIIKPTIEFGFDYKKFDWHPEEED